MSENEYPFNPDVVQTLARIGSAQTRLIDLSDEELQIIRSCVSAGANLLYPDTADSVENWLDDMASGSAFRVTYTRLFAHQEHSIGGNPVAWVSNTSQEGAGYYIQSASAINDIRAWNVYLPKGTYFAFIHTINGGGSGKIRVYADPTLLLDQDLYTATAAYNKIYTTGEFTMLTGGEILVYTEVYGKNAASSGYTFALSYIDILREPD